MGWKRFEKEVRKTGKIFEAECKRITKDVNCELVRFAERSASPATESGTLLATASAEEFPIVQQSAQVIQVTDLYPKEIISELKNLNPENLEPGRAYIINHLTFNNPQLKQRTGSEVDADRLQDIFQKFGMQVERVHDGAFTDVEAIMEKISLHDFENLACLVIVIMSHGAEGNIIYAKDREYSLTNDILYTVLQNKSLTSKLKLLITECCKGSVDPVLEIEGPRRRPAADPSEILQINSCVEGYVSYLHPIKGSIFINVLSKHLEQFGLKKNIADIATDVVADVKGNYCSIQIPMVHTTLTKSFVFGDYIQKGPTDSNTSSNEDNEEDDEESD